MSEPSVPLFRPERVYVEASVQELPYTQEILARLREQMGGDLDIEVLEDGRELKAPSRLTWAKKGLLLTRFRPDEPLREFTAMTVSTGRPTYSLNLISNCHLECTYCILQSYLANNPVIAVYTNLEEVFEKLATQLDQLPQGSIIGTGQIADSLALEELTGLHQKLIPYFAQQDRVRLEMKTKCADVAPLLDLDHGGQTVVSWSLSPTKVQQAEEYKTATIAQRIAAMQQCQQASYQIGIHLDPIIHHTGWEKNYRQLIKQALGAVNLEQVAWVSVGTLRFPSKQVRLMQERFPKNKRIFNNLKSTHRRFMHYPDRLREVIYRVVIAELKTWLPEEKIYVAMEAEQAVPAAAYVVAS